MLPFDIFTRLRRAFRAMLDEQRAQTTALTTLASQQQAILQQLDAIRISAQSSAAFAETSALQTMAKEVAEPNKSGRVIDIQGVPKFIFQTHQDLTDTYISEQIAQEGTWEPLETDIFQRLVRHYRLFVDLGANIGWYSAVAKAVMPKGSNIFAFEPGPENFALLQRNTASHTDVSIILERVAVADKPGTLNLYLSEDNQGDHRIYSSETGRDSIEIKVVTLDDYFQLRSPEPFLLKCDTQGSEPKIVRGARKTIADQLPLSTFILEFWPYGMTNAGEDINAFVAELSTWPHLPFVIDNEAHGLRPITWAELLKRCGSDIAPETQGFVDLLLVVPATPMFSSISDLILK